jgi:hypothetical protein
MKTLLLATALAAIVSTAARADAEKWTPSFRRCEVAKSFFTKSDPGIHQFENGTVIVSITPADVADVEEGLGVLRRCARFWKCVEDRAAGRVRHCYENDRRWAR